LYATQVQAIVALRAARPGNVLAEHLALMDRMFRLGRHKPLHSLIVVCVLLLQTMALPRVVSAGWSSGVVGDSFPWPICSHATDEHRIPPPGNIPDQYDRACSVCCILGGASLAVFPGAGPGLPSPTEHDGATRVVVSAEAPSPFLLRLQQARAPPV
jgi:hypothetical protein